MNRRSKKHKMSARMCLLKCLNNTHFILMYYSRNKIYDSNVVCKYKTVSVYIQAARCYQTQACVFYNHKNVLIVGRYDLKTMSPLIKNVNLIMINEQLF